MVSQATTDVHERQARQAQEVRERAAQAGKEEEEARRDLRQHELVLEEAKRCQATLELEREK